MKNIIWIDENNSLPNLKLDWWKTLFAQIEVGLIKDIICLYRSWIDDIVWGNVWGEMSLELENGYCIKRTVTKTGWSGIRNASRTVI